MNPYYFSNTHSLSDRHVGGVEHTVSNIEKLFRLTRPLQPKEIMLIRAYPTHLVRYVMPAQNSGIYLRYGYRIQYVSCSLTSVCSGRKPRKLWFLHVTFPICRPILLRNS